MTSVGTVISYPIPAYQNLQIDSQFYQPSRFVISALTRGQTTLITTSTTHNYVIGQNVRLLIPAQYGSFQLNETQGYVLDVPAANQVTVDINSILANAFIASPIGTFPCQPQILAIGDINSGVTNTSGRTNNIAYIPGSFIDISPN
jgi:hypothetical protein